MVYGFIAVPSTVEEVKEIVALMKRSMAEHACYQDERRMNLEDDAQGLDFVPSEHEVNTERTDEEVHRMAEDA